MASGIPLGSSFRLTTPRPLLGNSSYSSEPARLVAGQVRHTAWDFHDEDTGTYWRIKPRLECFTADGNGDFNVVATQAGTWGTLPIHWTQQGVVSSPGGYNEVVFADNLAAFPTTGITTTVYIARDTNFQYRWTGTTYAKLSDSGLTTSQLAAINAASSPSGSNPFATVSLLAPLVRSVNGVLPASNGNVTIATGGGGGGGVAGVSSVNSRAGDVILTSNDVGLFNVTNDTQVKLSERAAANGVASLDGTGQVPLPQLSNHEGRISALETPTPSNRTLWVAGNTGSYTPQVGNISRPYRQPVDAYNAAFPGDSMVIMPPSNVSMINGRGVYNSGVAIEKSLDIIGLGRPQISFTDVGSGELPTPTRVSFDGIDFSQPMLIAPSNIQGLDVIFINCTFGPNFYLRLGRGIGPNTSVNRVSFTGCVIKNTRSDFSFIALDESTTTTTRFLVEFTDTTINLATRPFIEGSINNTQPQHTKVLFHTGTTVNLLNSQAMSTATDPSGVPLTSSFWLIDERSTGPSDPSIQFQAEHNGVAGFSNFIMTRAYTLSSVNDAYNSTVWRWQLIKPDGTAIGPIRTLLADCQADLAAGWGVTPKPAFLMARHEVVRTSTSDTASYNFNYVQA